MRIEETFRLDAPRGEVFAFLSDGARVAACVPGVEDFTEREDGLYEAKLKAQLGPIKAMFAGQVSLETTPPGHLEASGRGQDRSSGSRAEINFTGDLEEVDGGRATRVDTAADVTIRGRLGQFGTGVIRATATELIREFVACANSRLSDTTSVGEPATARGGDGARGASAPAADSPSSGPAQTSQLRLVGRILLRLVRNAWERVLGAVRSLLRNR